MESLRQSVTFSLVVGRQRYFTTLCKTKTALTEVYGDSLVVCSCSNPSQLLKLGRDCYIGEIQNAPKASPSTASVNQQKRSNSLRYYSAARSTTDFAEIERIELQNLSYPTLTISVSNIQIACFKNQDDAKNTFNTLITSRTPNFYVTVFC